MTLTVHFLCLVKINLLNGGLKRWISFSEEKYSKFVAVTMIIVQVMTSYVVMYAIIS